MNLNDSLWSKMLRVWKLHSLRVWWWQIVLSWKKPSGLLLFYAMERQFVDWCSCVFLDSVGGSTSTVQLFFFYN